MTHTVIYDEQRLFSEAFAEALRRAGTTAMPTSSRAEAVGAVRRTDPDLVVINFRPRPAAAFDLVSWIHRRSPGTRIVCLDADDRTLHHCCLELGATVVMSKRQPLHELIDELVGEPSTAQPLSRNAAPVRTGSPRRQPRRQRGSAPLAAQFLTRRERDVLRLMVAATPTKDIARRLGVRVPTARGYIQSMFTKLGVHSRVEAVTYAVVHSVVDLDGTDDLASPG